MVPGDQDKVPAGPGVRGPWIRRYLPVGAALHTGFIEAARPGRHAPEDRWFDDKTYVKVAGQWTYFYRAAGQYGQVVDVLLSGRRDLAAARRFFTGRCAPARSRLRSPPTGRPYTRVCSMIWSPRRCLLPVSMRIIRSRRITGG